MFSPDKKSSMLIGVIAGLIDVIIVVGAALTSNSTVLLADMLKTILEFIAVLIAWYTVYRTARTPNQNFQYGMGKLENLSSIVVAMLMAVCILVIAGDAVRNIIHPSRLEGVGIWISMSSEVIYGVINGYLWIRNRRLFKETSSPMIASQEKLFLTKTLGNIFIFSSVALSCLLVSCPWSVYIDPLASILIAVSILLGAFGILSSSLFDLMDRTLEESDQIVILQALAKYFQEYQFLHGIRSRRSGSSVFIDIYLEFQPDKPVGEVQKIIDAIRRHIEGEIRGSHVFIGLSTHKEC